MALKLGDIPKLLKVTSDTLKSKKTMKVLGDELAERIVKRTRLGKGVKKPLAEATPLKNLETSTKSERKRLKKQGKLTGKGAKPSKAGLNRTGEMLDDVKAKVRQGELEIVLNSQKSKDKAENLIKIDKDNTFMNVSKAEFKGAARTLNDILNKTIKRLFK